MTALPFSAPYTPNGMMGRNKCCAPCEINETPRLEHQRDIIFPAGTLRPRAVLASIDSLALTNARCAQSEVVAAHFLSL